MKYLLYFVIFLFYSPLISQTRENRPQPILLDSSMWLSFTNDSIWDYDTDSGKWIFELHKPERIRILKYQFKDSVIYVLQNQIKEEILDKTWNGGYHYGRGGKFKSYDYTPTGKYSEWKTENYIVIDYICFKNSIAGNTIKIHSINNRSSDFYNSKVDVVLEEYYTFIFTEKYDYRFKVDFREVTNNFNCEKTYPFRHSCIISILKEENEYRIYLTYINSIYSNSLGGTYKDDKYHVIRGFIESLLID